MFTGRARTVPWPTKTNDPLREDLMNWNILFDVRDKAWNRTQGLIGSWLVGPWQTWVNNHRSRPDQAGPMPDPPKAIVVVAVWVEKVDSWTGQVELDGDGRPVKMFQMYDIIPGRQPACPIPEY